MSSQQAPVFLAPQPSGALNEEGNRWAVVLLHGFTAGPGSVLPWGQALASAGATVLIPLLAGHGTTVADLAQTKAGHWRRQVQQVVDALLSEEFNHVAVGGLSMGGALALDAAANRQVSAVFVVNPGLSFKLFDGIGAVLAPLIAPFTPTVGPLAGDIKKPQTHEAAYDRTPVAAVHELAKLFRVTRQHLPRINAPVTLYRSRTDHIVPTSSSSILARSLRQAPFDKVVLDNSYHVATLDYDAATIQHDSINRLLNFTRGRREP